MPKDGGKQTRLIFHLSYDFPDCRSVNFFTPQKYCTVVYRDLDHAVKESLGLLEQVLTGESGTIWYGKSDLTTAFQVLGLNPMEFWLLIMKVTHPVTGITYYFVDKCLPFGHSIGCALYQKFSDALAHIVQYLIALKTGTERTALTNYLDDFLFASLLEQLTNRMIDIFLDMCDLLGVPVSIEKNERVCNAIVFLGILLDGHLYVLVIPQQKKEKALTLQNLMLDKKSATVHELQGLAGLLNFLHRAIVPGRAFTRRMYAKFSHIIDKNGNKVAGAIRKPHHHVRLDAEFKADCNIWREFLVMQDKNKSLLCRPFVDVSETPQAETLKFFMDVAKGERLGMGGCMKLTVFLRNGK